MKKHDLLKYIDDDLINKLFGFSCTRTSDSYEAEELCSDIIYELVKTANTDGEIENIYSFIWRIARNVYADFSKIRRIRTDNLYEGDPEEIFPSVVYEEFTDFNAERLEYIYRRIAFLTKAYRDTMIMFYIDGLSTSEIAEKQKTKEGNVRQRLFYARQKIKSEVEEMTKTENRPIQLSKVDYVIWGNGSPAWGDPRDVFQRMFSKHIVWLCRKKPMSASEIAEELNVPTLYVEEELEILRCGSNGEYGLLRRLDNGKYAINFVLLEKDAFEKATAIYMDELPKICDTIRDYIEKHRDEYLAFPYLNKKVDMNLVLWQQVSNISWAFSYTVERILKEKYFSDVECVKRPFTVFGYVDNGKRYGGGWDGVDAQNICGYSSVHLDNIYITRIKKHFSCGLNVSKEPRIQLAISAIDGLYINNLSEKEKEYAAQAIECGYLYRDGDMLYTKILVNKMSDDKDRFTLSNSLQNGYFDSDAEKVAEKIAELIKRSIPEHLYGEWKFANDLASLPILDAVVECLIEKGLLIPPKDGIGAEGCFMSVEK